MKEALERQTATGEILRVISSSPTDTQPVFDAIARNAVALCGGIGALVLRFDGEMLHVAGHHAMSPKGVELSERAFPRRPGRDYPPGRAFLDRNVVHVPDLQSASEFGASTARQRGAGSQLAVPLLHEGKAIGVIGLARDAVGPFSPQQIEMLETFADQAVIAIANVRLFTELQEKNQALTQAHAQVSESLERQTATSEILRVISASPTDVQPVFEAVVRSAARLCDAFDATIFRLDTNVLRIVAHEGPIAAYPLGQGPSLARGSLLGRAVLDRRTIHVADMQAEVDEYPLGSVNARRFGHRTALAVPLLRYGEAIGVIAVRRTEARPFTDRQVELLQTFADQAAIAIENVRLFKELEVANRELSAASQHKSEFLANMSHELRTPLNAIIGYSEMLQEEAQDLHQDAFIPDLEKINAAAKHQLSLINDILDLSKIEAGRMELELTDFDLPSAIDNALTLVSERATRRGITLGRAIDDRVGVIQGDERKVRQVLLNLLSNALKFTPEGGRIDVRAGVHDKVAEVSVTDTGVGIAPEDQEAVFEEFRQVGTADKKVEGTGLGLALSRKFIELHGGRIWVTSAVGVGSTFTFTLPVRREEPILLQ
jgi:signal transduction histidine kinase